MSIGTAEHVAGAIDSVICHGCESRLDRVATAILERIGERLWGFRPRPMQHIVEDRGAFGSLAWFLSNMPGYERTLAAEGALRMHLWCTAISIDNGCAYCTYGHGLALELAYLRDHSALFAIDERTLVGLVTKDHVKRRQSLLVDAIAASGLAGELPAVERLWDLKDGAVPVTRSNRRVAHLLRLFMVLNTCGRDGCVAPDEAHDPLNRDVALKERYRAVGGQKSICTARLDFCPPTAKLARPGGSISTGFWSSIDATSSASWFSGLSITSRLAPIAGSICGLRLRAPTRSSRQDR